MKQWRLASHIYDQDLWSLSITTRTTSPSHRKTCEKRNKHKKKEKTIPYLLSRSNLFLLSYNTTKRRKYRRNGEGGASSHLILFYYSSLQEKPRLPPLQTNNYNCYQILLLSPSFFFFSQASAATPTPSRLHQQALEALGFRTFVTSETTLFSLTSSRRHFSQALLSFWYFVFLPKNESLLRFFDLFFVYCFFFQISMEAMILRRGLDSIRFPNSRFKSASRRPFFTSTGKPAPRSCPFPTMMRTRFSGLSSELRRESFHCLLLLFFVFLYVEFTYYEHS